MKKVLNHIKQYCNKEFSLLLVFAVLLISELANCQTAASNRFKRIDYEYDLISGKVNTVSYQKDSVDQFIHQYTYDSDNRITKVETSSDNVVWDIDAKYYYYAHGPLSRTELGNNKVQGVDYAYTLQGWIKGVNSNSLDKTRDMGQDGLANGIYDPANPQLHSNVASDAFGYTLNYFQKDYRAINVSRWSDVTNRFEAEASATSTLKTNRFDLFNGNISSMVTTITQLDSTAAGLVKAQIPKPLGNSYKYDQLNRLKKSVSFNNTDLPNNLWLSSGQAVANMYSNTFTYDANGNILSQNRNNELGTEFDAMSYNYKRDANNKFLQNRLYHVNDNTTYTALKTDDIDDEGTFTSDNLLINTNNNYGYDAIGNLTKDKAEQIDKIEWTVYGKIKSITRTGGSTKDNLVFNYDASGNRISKKVLDNGNNIKYTIYYVRDAQGNVMSTYEHKYMAPAGGAGTPVASFVLQEQHLYGSSRIGMNTPNTQLIYPTVLSNGTAYNHLQGLKQFELSNHLGNVLAVITDRKLPVDDNGDNTIDYYQADITSTSDYSAFGVKLYNRGFSFDKYRYGFNGQEKVDEISGNGNHNTALFWEYDTRLGRRWNLDPKPQTNISDYACFANSPTWFTDVLGDEVDIKHRKGFLGLGKKETLKYDGGKLYNKDGSDYAGKVRGFLKQSVNALNDIRGSREGGEAIEELESSKNVFTIEKSDKNDFSPTSALKGSANIPELQAVTGNVLGSTGTGGTIHWNPNSTEGGMNQAGRTSRPAFLGLGHELFHARDGNQGVLHLTSDYTNLMTGAKYSAADAGLKKAEWRAVFYENNMRSQLGMSLRTHYGLKQQQDGSYMGNGPSLLDGSNKPINYPIK